MLCLHGLGFDFDTPSHTHSRNIATSACGILDLSQVHWVWTQNSFSFTQHSEKVLGILDHNFLSWSWKSGTHFKLFDSHSNKKKYIYKTAYTEVLPQESVSRGARICAWGDFPSCPLGCCVVGASQGCCPTGSPPAPGSSRSGSKRQTQRIHFSLSVTCSPSSSRVPQLLNKGSWAFCLPIASSKARSLHCSQSLYAHSSSRKLVKSGTQICLPISLECFLGDLNPRCLVVTEQTCNSGWSWHLLF